MGNAAACCTSSGSDKFEELGGGCPFRAIVKATAPAVAPKVPEIINDFYDRLFENNPETKAFFNPANQFAKPATQRQALGNAVVAYASNIEDLTPILPAVELIAQKHVALGVLPVHYGIVHKNLMASIGHIMGEAVGPEEANGWSEAVLALAKALTQREEELYKLAEGRTGGWRGQKDFKLIQKRQVAKNCIEFTWEALGDVGPIDFTPGQYLTVFLKQEGATPRHYTVTSKPGERFLQCCVKLIPGGVVSTALHALKEGDVVGLSPPMGNFTLKDRPAVLVSAGIGATPMRAFAAANPEKVKLMAHIDRNKEEQPFQEEFAAMPNYIHYTQGKASPKACCGAQLSDRITGPMLVKDALQEHLADCDFYLCGPDAWQTSLKMALESAGAQTVYTERFAPELS